MKKITLATALALAALTTGAQTIGNPVDPNNRGADGETHYIVAYDLANAKWCEANPEIDETFVFAIDFTGTGLEDKMKTLPSPNRGGILGRSGAFDIYNLMNLNDDDETAVAKADGRLFPIDRDKNIYGMTVNLYQLITSRLNDGAFGPNADYTQYKVCTPGQTFMFADNVFAFGWTASNPGGEWWDGIGAPVQDVLAWTMAPYTGTKTGAEFTYGSLHADDTACPLEGLDLGAWKGMVDNWGGYGTPADFAKVSAGVNEIAADGTAEVASYEYFDLMGRRVAGVMEQGVTIRRAILVNGTTRIEKIAR